MMDGSFYAGIVFEETNCSTVTCWEAT